MYSKESWKIIKKINNNNSNNDIAKLEKINIFPHFWRTNIFFANLKCTCIFAQLLKSLICILKNTTQRVPKNVQHVHFYSFNSIG